MVGVNGEEGKAVQIERAFVDGPNDSQALQLDSRVTLLGRGQPLGPTVDDLKVLGSLGIHVNVSEGITQTMEAGGIGSSMGRNAGRRDRWTKCALTCRIHVDTQGATKRVGPYR